MRARKHLTLALAGVVGLVGVLTVGQSLSIYYRSSQFDDYLKHEVWRTRVTQSLKVSLLDKAKTYSLPVNEDDIRITANGAVFRVDVDYQVPMNLIVFEHLIKFHSIGAGLLRE
jgi:hypothetical protein